VILCVVALFAFGEGTVTLAGEDTGLVAAGAQAVDAVVRIGSSVAECAEVHQSIVLRALVPAYSIEAAEGGVGSAVQIPFLRSDCMNENKQAGEDRGEHSNYIMLISRLN